MRLPIVKLPFLSLVSSLLPIILLAAGEVEAVDPGKVSVWSPLGERSSAGDGLAGDSEGIIAPQQRGSPARRISTVPVAQAGVDSSSRGDLFLRLSTRPSTDLLRRTTDDKRARLRVANELAATLYAQARQQLAVAAQLRHIEAALAALRRKAERQAKPGEQARIALPTTVALSAPATISGQAQGSLSPPIAPIDEASAAEITDWWLGMASVLGVIAFLVWFFRRQAGR